jgi:hypothetical protein
MNLIKTFLFAAIIIIFAAQAYAADKIEIGAVEDIVIMPFGAKVPARIDTGAALSSIDVAHYSIEGDYVTFTLAKRCGGHKIRSRLIGVKLIRSSNGSKKRPIIELDICMGAEVVRTLVTINDRSKMQYPFLMGRQTFQGKFVVDVSRRNILPPTCACDNFKPSAHPE